MTENQMTHVDIAVRCAYTRVCDYVSGLSRWEARNGMKGTPGVLWVELLTPPDTEEELRHKLTVLVNLDGPPVLPVVLQYLLYPWFHVDVRQCENYYAVSLGCYAKAADPDKYAATHFYTIPRTCNAQTRKQLFANALDIFMDYLDWRETDSSCTHALRSVLAHTRRQFKYVNRDRSDIRSVLQQLLFESTVKHNLVDHDVARCLLAPLVCVQYVHMPAGLSVTVHAWPDTPVTPKKEEPEVRSACAAADAEPFTCGPFTHTDVKMEIHPASHNDAWKETDKYIILRRDADGPACDDAVEVSFQDAAAVLRCAVAPSDTTWTHWCRIVRDKFPRVFSTVSGRAGFYGVTPHDFTIVRVQ